ncbi:uncharacterized protein LOC114869251 [Betta splendens]|uniref:Uncharacterized protein LOC114869251 n=1 Tax=Betta splendens TaxID=158456 RepID=A0A6P7PHL7_BETSP|nr:uncharacterized protein LOC114869251 [Betta splendens]
MVQVINSAGMETLVRLIVLLPVTVTPQRFEADPVTVTAAVGSDVILPCVSKDEINVTDLIIDWTKEGDEIYIFQEKKPSFRHKDYKDRTSVFTKELQNNNFSIKLFGVKQTDEGQFSCCYYGDGKGRRCTNVTLTVITESSANISEVKENPKDPDLRPDAAVMAAVLVLLCVGLGVGSFISWKRRNGCGAQDETQTNTETQQNRAEATSLTVVTMSDEEQEAEQDHHHHQ